MTGRKMDGADYGRFLLEYVYDKGGSIDKSELKEEFTKYLADEAKQKGWKLPDQKEHEKILDTVVRVNKENDVIKEGDGKLKLTEKGKEWAQYVKEKSAEIDRSRETEERIIAKFKNSRKSTKGYWKSATQKTVDKSSSQERGTSLER